MNTLAKRVLWAYGQAHPSMYQFMRWRLSKENAEAIAKSLGHPDPDVDSEQITMLGMPVDLTDGDEILLVIQV